MRVLVVRNAQYDNNASMQRVVTALSEKGHKVSILSRNRNCNKNKKLSVKNGEIIVNNFEIGIKSRYGKNIFGIFNIFKYNISLFKYYFNNRNEIDTIHSYDLDTAFITKIFTRIFNKYLVYHIADFYADSRGDKYKILKCLVKKIEFNVINKADVTIICTEQRKEQILGSKPKVLKVIHNTPIFEDKCSTYVVNHPIRLAYVGGLAKSRFIPELIDVVKEISEVSLKLAGTGRLNEYVKVTTENIDNITYLGKVDYEEARKVLRESDLMIAMYDPEVRNHIFAAPNKIYESMTFNKPIIVARNTGLSNLVKKYDFGWLIDYSSEKFKSILEEIIKNPIILEKKSINSKMAYEEYNWDKTRKNIQKIYDDLR